VSSAKGTLVVMAKSPVAGQVKTRLTTGFTAPQAAALAQAMLRDTLDAVSAAPASRRVVAWEGARCAWLRLGLNVIAQRGDGLDERLSFAFEEALSYPDHGPILLVGMDTPQLRPADLSLDWEGADAVLGLCPDGGYWAIGMKWFHPEVIRGVPMSTPRTGRYQLERMQSLGFRVRLLRSLRDVDTPADATAVARVAADTRFGRLHRRLTGVPCSPMALYEEALDGMEVDASQVQGDNEIRRARLAVGDWQRLAPADEVLLSRCEGPVLDIGCGPGRLVESLAARGVATLGIDVSPRALSQAAARGACVLRRAVQHRLPGEGHWGTVLLADGNIGIGGDPGALLARCHDLLTCGGVAIVEADADDDTDLRISVTLHCVDGRVSSPMTWARVGARPLVQLASQLGFVAVEDWRVDGRVFIALRKVI
jgi:rSAM/selenodomain-associated transferase 1